MLSIRGDHLPALKMANNGSLFEPGKNCSILDSAVTGHNLVLDHLTRIIASLSEKMISPRAKWREGRKPFFACGTMFDNLKKEKNAKRYTERKHFENSNVSVAAAFVQ